MFKKEIWAIGGGKGGVGKSVISSNIAIDLAQRGNQVIILDADFGGANVHTCLGVKSPPNSISDFLNDRGSKLSDILSPTGISNLSLASGAQDSLQISNIKHHQLLRLKKAILKIEADYIVIDLGAGTSNHILDLFLEAARGVLVTVPEPTSIENTYRFIKSAFYRKLNAVISHPEIRSLLEKIISNRLETVLNSPAELLDKIDEVNVEAGRILRNELEKFIPKLIINQVRQNNDIRIGFVMKETTKKYFGIAIDYVGYVEHDDVVINGVRSRKPVIANEPFAKFSRNLKKIVENLVSNSQIVSSVLYCPKA